MSVVAVSRKLPMVAGFVYGLLYLFAIGDLSTSVPASWDAMIAELSVERILKVRSLFLFEAVMILQVGYLVWLLSPLNLAIAVTLGLLVAANVHGMMALRQDPSCRIGGGGVVAGAAPALLSAGACCAPSLVILLGLPALGAFAAMFAWLLPMSVLALTASRIWQRRLGAPPLVGISVGRGL